MEPPKTTLTIDITIEYNDEVAAHELRFCMGMLEAFKAEIAKLDLSKVPRSRIGEYNRTQILILFTAPQDQANAQPSQPPVQHPDQAPTDR